MTETLLEKVSLHQARQRREAWLGGAAHWPRANVPVAPRCFNPERRRASKSLRLFKQFYFPKKLYPKFTEDPNGRFHGPFLDKLEWLIKHRSVVYCAKAAPRGIGKTIDVDIAAVYAICHRLRDLILRIELERKAAEDRVEAVQKIFMNNPLLLEDFPEIVQPILDFGGDPRAAFPLEWSALDLRFSNWVWHCARGIDGTIRGFNKGGERPDLVLINDIESAETIHSEAMSTLRRERMLEICGLEGQGEHVRCSFLYTQTVPAAGCIADEYTDQAKQPAWNGQRDAAMLSMPLRLEMWARFVELCRLKPMMESDADRAHFFGSTGSKQLLPVAPQPLPVAPKIARTVGMDVEMFAGLDFGYRKALEYYAENKALMDEGIEMLEPLQLPAHKFYWYQANMGEAWIASEMQNDPKANPNIRDLQLEAHALMARRVATLPERVVPSWARYLTVTVDLGLYRCHWQADAWSADGVTSHLVECGIEETGIDDRGQWKAMADPTGKQLMADEAIKRTLERIDAKMANRFKRSEEYVNMSLGMIDCGGTAGASVRHAWDKVVFAFCASRPRWLPAKGESPWTESISDRAGQKFFICEEKNNPGNRIDCHVDAYKKRAYDAYQLPLVDEQGQPVRGTRTLHQDRADRSLAPYCAHQSSEKHVERFVPGKTVEKSQRIGWEPATKQKPINHWWDTCWMAYACVDILRWKLGRAAPRRVVGVVPAAMGDASMG